VQRLHVGGSGRSDPALRALRVLQRPEPDPDRALRRDRVPGASRQAGRGSAAMTRSVLPCLPVAIVAALVASPAAAQDPRVDALIQRLEAQEREIQALREEVRALRQGVVHDPKHPEYRREDGQYPLTDYDAPRIRLDIAGQINQAFTVGADGKQTKGYFVD